MEKEVPGYPEDEYADLKKQDSVTHMTKQY